MNDEADILIGITRKVGFSSKNPCVRDGRIREALQLAGLGTRKDIFVTGPSTESLSPMSSPIPVLPRARDAWQMRDYESARRLLHGHLTDHPGDVSASLLLSRVEADSGRHPEARDALTSALAGSPDEPRLLIAMGMFEQTRGELEAAEARFRAVLDRDPVSLAAAAALAGVLERQGNPEGVLAAVDGLVDGEATAPVIAAPALRAFARLGQRDKAIELGRAVAGRLPRPNAPLRDMLLSLARELERDESYDEAFRIARRANAIGEPAFDRAGFAQLVDHMIDVFDGDTIARLRDEDDGRAGAVFIVGMPRCGSTLVERMLSMHPDVFGAGEVPDFHRLVASLGAAYPDTMRDIDPLDAARHGRSYMTRIRARACDERDVSHFINKDLGMILHAGCAAMLLPGAKFIRVRRDPEDNLLACWMERLRPGVIPYKTRFKRLATVFRAHERLAAHWSGVLGDQWHEVTYEELVQDPETHARRLTTHLGLPWDDACLAFHESDRRERTLSFDSSRQAMFTSSIGRASRFGHLLDPLRSVIADGSDTPT